MKYKKLLPIFLISLFLLATLVSAVLSPEPVAGKISLPGYPHPEGLLIYQKNLRTLQEVSKAVDANGYYVIDW